ncbi:MAG: hypothetical protein ACTSRP_12760 [Candidatus Helarchaeota archaeon]
MYINRQAHGPWCTTRRFVMRCPKCNKEVLYWECEHGCKVFFDLPLRRPLTKHKCNRKSYRELRIEMEIELEEEFFFIEDHICPVCYRNFKNEKDLKNHLKSLKNQDDEHKECYRKMVLGKK